MSNKENLFHIKPSEILGAGVGCFAMSYINSGERLNSSPSSGTVHILPEYEIPDVYLKYCPRLPSGLYLAPTNFNIMSVFWYINHSSAPNTIVTEGRIYASDQIQPETELTMYYPDLLTHPVNKLWVRPEHI